jgi:membrane-associated phospholipid phosphatase
MRSERRGAREGPVPREDGERGCLAPARSSRAGASGTAGSAQAADTATQVSRRFPFRRASGRGEASKPRSLWSLYLLQGAYLVFLFTAFVVRGIGLGPDAVFLLLAIGFVWRGQRWSFVRDFGPFILLLLSYDAMRGFADDLNASIHYGYPIAVDKALFFGHVPSVELQRWLFDPDSSHWYDYAAALLHMLHFIVPLFFAAIIWQHYSRHYWPFVMSLLLVSYAAFITFLLVPTAPPWLAGRMGELPGVALVHDSLPAVAPVYLALSPNAVAAMPSLHAAYPWLFLLFAWRIWGWRAAPVAVYAAAVYFAIIYLGHHYVADVLGGVVYATAAYAIVCSPAAGRLAQAAAPLASRFGWRRAVEGGRGRRRERRDGGGPRSGG